MLLFSAGVHPWDIAKFETVEQAISPVLSLMEHKNVVLLGECGLDACIHTPMELQVEVFRQMVSLSEKMEKPLILHVVHTYNQIGALRKELKPSQPWIIHGFRGKPELAAQLQQAGFYLSLGEQFNPNVFQTLSPERLLLETDESSMFIGDIYKRVAVASGWNMEMLKDFIARNLQNIFRLNNVVN